MVQAVQVYCLMVQACTNVLLDGTDCTSVLLDGTGCTSVLLDGTRAVLHGTSTVLVNSTNRGLCPEISSKETLCAPIVA
jgi:hypothetical protein